MFNFLMKMFKFVLWVVVKTFSIFYCLVLTPLMIFYTIIELNLHDVRHLYEIDDDLQNEVLTKFSIVFCVDMIDAFMDRLAWWSDNEKYTVNSNDEVVDEEEEENDNGE